MHYWIKNPSRRDVFDVRSAYAQAAKRRLDAAGIEISPAAERELQGRIEVESDPDAGVAASRTRDDE
jgi:hypothetical protein